MSNLLSQASLVMIPSGYKEDVVYSQIPTNGNGDLSFTRASNGTRINSAGLVEVCPWNLVTYSNDFSSSWALVGSSKSTGVTDPIGNSNAIKLKYTTATSGHYITQGISLTGSNAHSVYAKAGELQFLQIASAQNIDEYANFNLGTGAIGTYGSRASNVQIENVGNGWYRCSVVFTSGSNGIYLAMVQSASSDWFGTSTYAGANSTDGLYLYGGQVNTGALKPYFPTTDRLNVPRLTYQNGGGGCPSLLLEKQSTNNVLYSEDFSQADWTKTSAGTGSAPVVTTNYATSPDGTQNADLVVFDRGAGNTSSDFSWLYQSFVTASATYTMTCYVKAATSGDVGKNLSWRNFGTGGAWSVNLTNEWQRISVQETGTGSSSEVGFYNRGTYSTGNSVSVLMWGFQAEQSSYETSYIPTTSSSATRVADECSKTGISSLIGQTEGVLFAEAQLNVKPENGSPVVGILTTNNNVSDLQNCIVLGVERNANGTNRIYCLVQVSNVTQAGLFGSNISSGRYKIALAYKANDFALYVNGVQVATDTSGSVPTTSQVLIGTRRNSDNYTLADGVSQAILFPTRLTNAELASLTTI